MKTDTKSKKPAMPSPLPCLPFKHDDGLISDANGVVLADTSSEYAALIVRRVNQGPAFDALVDLAERILSDQYDDARYEEQARAALKLAQSVK